MEVFDKAPYQEISPVFKSVDSFFLLSPVQICFLTPLLGSIWIFFNMKKYKVTFKNFQFIRYKYDMGTNTTVLMVKVFK